VPTWYELQVFNDIVGFQAEERKRQEQIDREDRRKQAEERRKAVVDRIRQKQEEELRAQREAEEALKRIQEVRCP
jgi:F0F1-type ATP synthase epsilon subunit